MLYPTMTLLYAIRDVFTFILKKRLCESFFMTNIRYSDVVFYNWIDSFLRKKIQQVQYTCCHYIYTHSLRKLLHFIHNNEFRIVKNWNLCTHWFRILVTYSSRSKNKEIIHCVNIRNKNGFNMPQYFTSIFQWSFSHNLVML